MATTITSVTLPAHMYPHTETRINDNSVRRYTTSTEGNYKYLAVSLTPKGVDGKITTVTGGVDEYDEIFGVGPCSIYGQAHLNARAAASTGKVTLQVLRLTAPDAAYANTHIYVHYKITEASETTETAKLKVMFTATSSALSNIDNLAASAPDVTTVQTDAGIDSSWTTIRFMSVAYVGRGKCGNNISVRMTNHIRADKTSGYKNYYFDVFEGTTLKEESRVTLYPDALNGDASLFLSNTVNNYDGTSGSDIIRIDVNEDVLPTLFAAYKANIDPSTSLTESSFDPILGINKYLASASSSAYASYGTNVAIAKYEIVSDAEVGTVQFNDVLGIKLTGGSDGVFDPSTDATTRQTAINAQFVKAFNGEIDRNILSKNRCPLDYATDADFGYQTVKPALAALCVKRAETFKCYFDLNSDLTTRTDPYESSTGYDSIINTWTESIDGYVGKIRDPYNKKVITVTSTYYLAQALPLHWSNYGGRHIPLAGSKYAIIDTFLPNSIFPVYDDSIDQDILDRLVDAHVNYAAIDARGNVIRATQTTRYSGSTAENQFAASDDYIVSNLSEENNALIVLDIKRDVEKLICTYSYNFNETSDINAFNRDTTDLASKYQAAQVRSITARFSRTTEEAELGVLHLYIAIENKPLIKYLQVDIDVNRITD